MIVVATGCYEPFSSVGVSGSLGSFDGSFPLTPLRRIDI